MKVKAGAHKRKLTKNQYGINIIPQSAAKKVYTVRWNSNNESESRHPQGYMFRAGALKIGGRYKSNIPMAECLYWISYSRSV